MRSLNGLIGETSVNLLYGPGDKAVYIMHNDHVLQLSLVSYKKKRTSSVLQIKHTQKLTAYYITSFHLPLSFIYD